MDWRERKYYAVSFDWRSRDMRLGYLRTIDGLRIHPYKNIEKQTDEKDARGLYQCLIGVPAESSDAVEYELRKAERNDDWCKWKEVQRKEKAR